MRRRRSRGYWDDVLNIKAEIDSLVEDEALQADVLPSKWSLKALGRYDVAKAYERHGGAARVRSSFFLLPGVSFLLLPGHGGR